MKALTLMRALSVRQPWAALIAHGGKTVENRQLTIASATINDPWPPVRTTADVCECDGGCGRPDHGLLRAHSAPRRPRQVACTRDAGARRRLVTAPTDPSMSLTAAARLPHAWLQTWCQDCLIHARRQARRARQADRTCAWVQSAFSFGPNGASR